MSAYGSLLNLTLTVVVLSSGWHEAGAQQNDSPRTFTLGCAPLELDLRSNQSVCTNVQISDGVLDISANLGTTSETGFEDSEWRLTEDIRIAFETTVLTADSAVFRFRNNELVFVELSGSPVELSDVIENASVVGTAERITLDNLAGTAEMIGQARLARGANEYLGCDLVYNLNEKTLDSGSENCRVQLRIFPGERQNSAPGDSLDAP